MSHPHTPAHWTPLQIAVYNLVHGFRHNGKKGAVAIAPFLGKSANSVSNEVNPDYEGAKFGLDDAVQAELIAKQYPILHAHAQMLNHACFPLPCPNIGAGDVALLSTFSNWQAAMGTTCQHIHNALEDGQITPAEYRMIADAGHAHMGKFMDFMERVKALQVSQ